MKILISTLLFIALFFVGCKDTEKKELDQGVYFCGAENLTENGERFISSGYEFEGGEGRTDEEAYEGKYSCVANKDNPYVFGIEIKDLQPSESYEVQVYRKSVNDLGGIAIHSLDGSLKLGEFTSLVEKDERGWDFLRLIFKLPLNIDSLEGIKVFLWFQNSDEKVYFDNFQIRKIEDKEDNRFSGNETIKIRLSDIDYRAISEARDIALKTGIISKELKKTYRGFLAYKERTVSVEVRLKGDWSDHLIGNKWSYRIKVKNGETFLGLKSFSIQNPSTRGFLHEWVFHKLLEEEDVLTTRYDFVPVSVNGVNFGLYALEEHFEKRLLEHKRRREGVIVKFDESSLWEARKNREYSESHNEDFLEERSYEIAEIMPFSKKKTKKTLKLYNQFLRAQNHMYKYKEGTEDVEKYMDINQLAKAYALMVVGNVDHSLIWHNQRFYFNPVTAKLELILFDCYPNLGAAKTKPMFIYGGAKVDTTFVPNSKYNYYNTLGNPELQEAYLYYLKKYSSANFIDEHMAKLSTKIDSLSSLIAIDNGGFNYDKSYLSTNAELIRKFIPDYEKKVRSNKDYYKLKPSSAEKKCKGHDPLKSAALNAHLQRTNKNGSVKLSLKNYHCDAIKVVGFNTKENPDSLQTLATPFELKAYENFADIYSLSIQKHPKTLFYKVISSQIDSVYSTKIIPWQRPELESELDQLMNSSLSSTSSLYEIEDGVISFRKGRYVVEENIIIPKGIVVIFEPGVELIFNKYKFFISYSAITMNGTNEEPIKITSEDGTGNGFAILQAKNRSELKNVIFDGLNTFSITGVEHTGAVTFYESDVNLFGCAFRNNHSEDALNIIRSSFKLEKCIISNTFSDGFDADFCEGTVSNTTFVDIGNDCLDFSGSTVDISNGNINNVGDKGVSCGENSIVTISNTQINNANIGVASKDNSKVKIKGVKIFNCQIGLSAFQKKPEYGPGLIQVESCLIEQTKRPYSVEEGSEIILNSEKRENIVSATK